MGHGCVRLTGPPRRAGRLPAGHHDARGGGRPGPGGRGGGPAALPGPAPLHRRVPATADAPVGLRAELRAWFDGLPVPPRRPEDLVLAVYEALTDAVEHAYRDRPPGEVELRVDRPDPDLRVVVADHGTRRDPDPDPGARGHGLRLMRALADAAAVGHRPDGTTVTLTWHPGPAGRR